MATGILFHCTKAWQSFHLHCTKSVQAKYLPGMSQFFVEDFFPFSARFHSPDTKRSGACAACSTVTKIQLFLVTFVSQQNYTTCSLELHVHTRCARTANKYRAAFNWEEKKLAIELQKHSSKINHCIITILEFFRIANFYFINFIFLILKYFQFYQNYKFLGNANFYIINFILLVLQYLQFFRTSISIRLLVFLHGIIVKQWNYIWANFLFAFHSRCIGLSRENCNQFQTSRGELQ